MQRYVFFSYFCKMNWLQYFIGAQTQYNIHSPFVFELYNEVLFARLPKATRSQFTGQEDQRHRELVYKLQHHYHLKLLAQDTQQTLLEGDEDFGRVVVVNEPHRDAASERYWNELLRDSTYRVSIDIYHNGLLFTNPRLHTQHFMLR